MVRVVVIGGGPAGTFAAIAARKQDADAAVTLLTRERCEPYEKPPLSKAVLLGRVSPDDAPIAGPAGVAGHGVVLETSADCTAIDRTGHVVVLADGRCLPYEALVIATGSTPREIPQLPVGAPRTYYLRTEADARVLKAALAGCRDLLVVGGGLIGLEVASSGAMLGVKVTVLEVAQRILARVCDEQIGGAVHEAHARHGVDIRIGTTLLTATAQTDGRIAAVTGAGDRFVADIVVVGTGSKPDDTLAASAGSGVMSPVKGRALAVTSTRSDVARSNEARTNGCAGSVPSRASASVRPTPAISGSV